jgi:hypothetical protein
VGTGQLPGVAEPDWDACAYGVVSTDRCLSSQEHRPRVLLEQIGPSDVAPERVDALVAGYLHHLERRCAGLGRTMAATACAASAMA